MRGFIYHILSLFEALSPFSGEEREEIEESLLIFATHWKWPEN
jgi:hypothetical protein